MKSTILLATVLGLAALLGQTSFAAGAAGRSYLCKETEGGKPVSKGMQLKVRVANASITFTGINVFEGDGMEYVDVSGNLITSLDSKLPDAPLEAEKGLAEDWKYIQAELAEKSKADQKQYQLFGVLDLYEMGNNILSEYGGYALMDPKLTAASPAKSGSMVLIANTDSGPGEFLVTDFRCRLK